MPSKGKMKKLGKIGYRKEYRKETQTKALSVEKEKKGLPISSGPFCCINSV